MHIISCDALKIKSVADLGLGLRNAPVRVEKRDQVMVYSPGHYKITYPQGIKPFCIACPLNIRIG